jgi:hypothetical protein
MTDVFIRSWIKSADTGKQALRNAMLAVSCARWRIQPDANWTTVYAPHMEAKRWAEQRATTDPYIVADEDCLILGADFVSKGLAAVRAHPDYGILTAVSVIENADILYRGDVIERHAVGGVAFVRRGILTEFRDCPANQTDDAICSEITRKGYKTGVMPCVQMNHLGYGYSLTSGDWRA